MTQRTELPVDPLARLRERKSAKWHSYPDDVLPLTLAEMDYALAPAVAEALRDAIDRSDAGYPLARPLLGEALSGFAARRWGWDIEPASVTAVPDVGVGLVELLRVLVRPGQAVVVSSPVYPPFYDWVEEAGAVVMDVPLAHDESRGWRLDIPAVEKAFAEGAAAYLLCHPHNPVGRVHSPEELERLVALAHRYDAVLISDEIHAPLVLPGARFTPLLTIPGAADVAITVLAASKTWNVAGLKCAAIVTASTTMAGVVDRLPVEVSWRVGHFGVIASVAALTLGEEWLDDLIFTLDRRRTQLASLVATRLPALNWHAPEGTYFAWLDCTVIGTGDQARDLFLERGRVALEPGSRFGAAGRGHARLNFATGAEILDHAITSMSTALEHAEPLPIPEVTP